eukprot:CAMPEP_0170568048 /NCGR_PEP_ID=MMETSP0211-20121228/80883_1 /TAXON_ID=311385 /ORGANISM="Pseudokeronopsis sp., Strain OXSARD2" /LENGTH=107 /DNA_ID=CAMNT_0010889701 /DNA_START=781 /DNA_END=1105 /DNA_ORIENTATION=+
MSRRGTASKSDGKASSLVYPKANAHQHPSSRDLCSVDVHIVGDRHGNEGHEQVEENQQRDTLGLILEKSNENETASANQLPTYKQLFPSQEDLSNRREYCACERSQA